MAPKTDWTGLQDVTVDGRKFLQWPMWPKIIQVNKTDVYVMGGNLTDFTNQYDRNAVASKVTFKIVLDRKILAIPESKLMVHRMTDMLLPRQAFGISAIGHFVYIGGGTTTNYQVQSSVHRFNVVKNTWHALL